MTRRSFAELSVSTFAPPLYSTLVRPYLDYAMRAYSSNLVADAECLERIQRLATRLVKGFRRLPCEDRLRWLGLHSLRRRRLRGDLLVVYKMFPRGLDLDPSLFFIPQVRPGLRGHHLSKFCRVLVGVVKYWEELCLPPGLRYNINFNASMW